MICVKMVNYNSVSPPPECNLNTSYAVVFGPSYKIIDQSLWYITYNEIRRTSTTYNIVTVSRDMIIN